jgi:hypothetical protein
LKVCVTMPSASSQSDSNYLLIPIALTPHLAQG